MKPHPQKQHQPQPASILIAGSRSRPTAEPANTQGSSTRSYTRSLEREESPGGTSELRTCAIEGPVTERRSSTWGICSSSWTGSRVSRAGRTGSDAACDWQTRHSDSARPCGTRAVPAVIRGCEPRLGNASCPRLARGDFAGLPSRQCNPRNQVTPGNRGNRTRPISGGNADLTAHSASTLRNHLIIKARMGEWLKMDPKTRGNIMSCVTNIPLASALITGVGEPRNPQKRAKLKRELTKSQTAH